MPTYRVISQKASGSVHRAQRGDDSARPENIYVHAENIPEVLTKLAHQKYFAHRIISIEEMPDETLRNISDEDLLAKLTTEAPDYQRIYPDEYNGATTPLYQESDFAFKVKEVVDTLRESGLIPGLDLSLLANDVGEIDYAMIEVYDVATSTFRSSGCDIKWLTDDRKAVGMEAILSIARRIIDEAIELI